MKGVQGFIGVMLWRPFTGVWALLTGLVSILAWYNVGEHWSSSTKVLVGVVAPLSILLIYVLFRAYSLYTKADRPLRVRKVLQGTHYYEGHVMVILERRDTVSVGDILTLFVREGDAETPICLLSVEGVTSKDFPQSVVLRPLTNIHLSDYLGDESRLDQLQAKRGVTRGHLEGGSQEWLTTQ